jgi:peptide/nickel transport system permease protein
MARSYNSARLWKNRQAQKGRDLPPLIPVFVVAVFVLVGATAPIISPHSPVEGTLASRLLPPVGLEGANPNYLLGTDRLGRDVLSRLIYGAQVTLAVSLVSLLLTAVLGTLIGLISGYAGGWVDAILMRMVDISLSVPGILIALLLTSIFGASFYNVIITVIVIFWTAYARVVRGQALSLRHQDFVALARVAGCSSFTIMTRHLLPNLAPSVLVLGTLHVGAVIVFESSLSFLGVGIPPPLSSWGVMIAEGKDIIERAWWVSVVPGVSMVATVIALNTLGDWVRDRLDPKLRQI